jgi:hypothetical protein
VQPETRTASNPATTSAIVVVDLARGHHLAGSLLGAPVTIDRRFYRALPVPRKKGEADIEASLSSPSPVV